MEGIIKSVTIDPVKIDEGSAASLVKIYFNAAALAAMYEEQGIDPSTAIASYIVYNEDLGWNVDTINLAEAVETGHEISMLTRLVVASTNAS